MTAPRIDTLLVLGADGDLTSRLLLPGIATLLASDWGEGRPPPLVLGSGLEELRHEEWHERVRSAFLRADVQADRLADAEHRSRYRRSDVTRADDLRRLLADCEGAPAIYFALPPAVTALACEALAAVELPPGTVLVLEKPFGIDRDSAARLNRLLAELVPEEQVFRVDHFLGRSDVLNILGVRFGNRLLEPVWNRHHVDRVEIVYDEHLALEGRAGYYDHAGALADMVQSHLLQVMAVLMMEPIDSIDERDFRDAKAALLRATRLWGEDTGTAGRRARYTGGRLGERDVPAYADEEGVDPGRRTETLAELTLEVENDRWAGVPVVLRSGKAIGRARKAAVVTLKPVPRLPDGLLGHETPDTVTIGFKPPRVAIGLDVNGPGDPFDLQRADLDADLGSGELTAYGEVLRGVLDGDPLLSVRGDNAEECWRIVEPVVRSWREDEVPLESYPAGSAGPAAWVTSERP